MKKRLMAITACLAACFLAAGCAGNRAETGNSARQAAAQSSVESSAAPETAAVSEEGVSEAEQADETGAAAVSGDTPVVYFTSDISAEGLVRIYDTLGWAPEGRTAVKISTGEPPESNYLRPELIGDLVKKVDGTIVECNTA